MRIFPFVVVVALASAPVFSESRSADGVLDAETQNAACAQVGEVAESIMRLRQKNTPMSDLMKRTDETVGKETSETSKRYARFLRRLIVSAYEMPAYRVEKNQELTIQEFRNEAELACYAGGI